MYPRIKSYAEKIIPIIRMNDRDGIIIVGTPDWSSLGMSGSASGKEILKNPLTGNFTHNVMYSFHFYAASHGIHTGNSCPLLRRRSPYFSPNGAARTIKGREAL